MSNLTDGYFNLIISGGCSGSYNMSADLLLLNKYKTADGFSIHPTLRLYYFSPPTLSLGFFQKVKDIDLKIIENAKSKKYDIVSRPTGGRAVLHKSEITYSITASYKKGIFAGKLLETYKKIGEFLYLFFVKIGLKPDRPYEESSAADCNVLKGAIRRQGGALAKTKSGAGAEKEVGAADKRDKRSADSLKNNFNCFLKAHSYEITFAGRKICGNSQRRNDEAFLQHGSIYIDYNPKEHIEFFNGENSEVVAENKAADDSKYFNSITGIRQEMERAKIQYNLNDLSFDRLSKVMIESFSEAYNLKPHYFEIPPPDLF